MNLLEKRHLQVGDQVQWTDPNNEFCNGVYFVQDIMTSSGLIEDEDSILILSDTDGSCNEVLLLEVA